MASHPPTTLGGSRSSARRAPGRSPAGSSGRRNLDDHGRVGDTRYLCCQSGGARWCRCVNNQGFFLSAWSFAGFRMASSSSVNSGDCSSFQSATVIPLLTIFS